MQAKSREEIIRELKTIEPGSRYYATTLLGTEDGKIEWSTFTGWVGWVNGKPGREIRQASTVYPDRMVELWDDLGETYVVVNNVAGLIIYRHVGGHALVKKEIADKHLAYIVSPRETAFNGPRKGGFRSTVNIPDHAFKKAPRQKLRMHIIKRDRYRCRICGRRPDDYTDIELHVHHIRPWSNGGLTEDDNLITLCDTCHDGLDPHGEHSLFSLLEPGKWTLCVDKSRRDYFEGVRRYREAAQLMFKELKTGE